MKLNDLQAATHWTLARRAARMNPSVLREIWQGDFDYAYAHCPDAVYDLVLHPQAIGRGHRLIMLEHFIDYMTEKPGTVFRTVGDVVERWKASNPEPSP